LGSQEVPDGKYLYDSGTKQIEIQWVQGIGSDAAPAPQARLMATVINGILNHRLPWRLVFLGVFLVIAVELLGIRSLPFAVGSYISIATTMAMFAGGLVRWLAERGMETKKDAESEVSSGSLYASGLIAALPLDKDNLVVTVIVRQRFPKMRIVARSAERKFAERMLRAGANSTVSPSQIGGLRMASELIRPHVVGFLDLMLKEQGKTLRVEEIEVKAASPWAGSALHELNLKGRYNLLVLGLKRPVAENSPDLLVNPPDNSVVGSQAIIIAMGDVKDIQRARQDAGA